MLHTQQQHPLMVLLHAQADLPDLRQAQQMQRAKQAC
jgi:hypothetical protein